MIFFIFLIFCILISLKRVLHFNHLLVLIDLCIMVIYNGSHSIIRYALQLSMNQILIAWDFIANYSNVVLFIVYNRNMLLFIRNHWNVLLFAVRSANVRRKSYQCVFFVFFFVRQMKRASFLNALRISIKKQKGQFKRDDIFPAKTSN